MEIDVKAKIDEYTSLLEQIKEKVNNENEAVAVLQEIGKDLRTVFIQTGQDTNNDSLATKKQIGYLKRLGVEIPEGLTKKDASRLIDERTK